MEKMGIGTKEIELLAKKIDQKEGGKKSNKKNVRMIVKKRLSDALRREKEAKMEYVKDRQRIKETLKPTDGRSRLLWKTFMSVKKEISERAFLTGSIYIFNCQAVNYPSMKCIFHLAYAKILFFKKISQ